MEEPDRKESALADIARENILLRNRSRSSMGSVVRLSHHRKSANSTRAAANPAAIGGELQPDAVSHWSWPAGS